VLYILESNGIVDSWLGWKIVNGKKFMVGENPWVGEKGSHHLSLKLQDTLHNHNMQSLNDASLKIKPNH
jgi:hypothetical protein